MRISEQITQQPQTKVRQGEQAKSHYNPNFKGLGVDSVVINVMDAIERGGLFASFCIQDTLGTNLPRPIAGLTRNKKENAGKKNTTFALKEAIREFTTGPSMFIIPSMALAGLTRGIGKTTNVPAAFIKGLGDIYKNTVSPENITDGVKLKKDFYKNVVSNIIEETTGQKGKIVEKEIDEIASDLINLGSKKKKGLITNMRGIRVEGSQQDALNDVAEKFVKLTKKYADNPTSDFLTAKIKNAKVEGGSIATTFKKMVSHIADYSDDAIKQTQKNFTKAPENFVETVGKFVDKFNVKRINTRFGVNIGMMAAVMGFLSIIPKLYNISKDNPALRGLEEQQAQGAVPTANSQTATKPNQTQETTETDKKQTNAKQPSFGMNPAKMADNIVNGSGLSKIAKTIEFDGVDMSFPMLMTAMLGGVLAPRIVQAQDNYDREEIIRRDTISIATMGFGARALAKLFTKSSEAKSGYVLAIKDDAFKAKTPIGKFLDYLKPVKGIQILKSDALTSKYSNLEDYKKGIEGFCEFVDNQGGNLKKIFSTTDKSKTLLENICGGAENFAKADNKTISDSIKKAVTNKSKDIDDLYGLFKNNIGADGKTIYNEFLHKAKALNSKFDFLSMCVLVPAFLGFALPKINEHITKKKFKNRNAKAAETKPETPNQNGTAQTPTKIADSKTQAYKTYQNPYFMAVPKETKQEQNSVYKKIETKQK
ncbi:MAG: hypothetical protein PHV37_10290 [Candidatus Gastranaerophilales bacterium]|nr:hypothetical protein [Candidatus Gastranaerophilales bacterium]